MTRLSELLRKQIIGNTLKDTVLKEQDEHREAGNKLFDRIYNTVTTKEERKMLATLDERWIKWSGWFTCNASGWRVSFSLDKKYPDRWAHDTITIRDEALMQEARDWATKGEDIKKRLDATSRSLMNMLRTTNTVAQLEKTWPEGIAYWGFVKELESTKRTLPVVQVAEINTMLGLPKEAA